MYYIFQNIPAIPDTQSVNHKYLTVIFYTILVYDIIIVYLSSLYAYNISIPMCMLFKYYYYVFVINNLL